MNYTDAKSFRNGTLINIRGLAEITVLVRAYGQAFTHSGSDEKGKIER